MILFYLPPVTVKVAIKRYNAAEAENLSKDFSSTSRTGGTPQESIIAFQNRSC